MGKKTLFMSEAGNEGETARKVCSPGGAGCLRMRLET
jgi:hypothetical protein